MSQIEYSQTLGQQEEMEHLLTQESFDKWLYENFVICNGDMFIRLYEDTDNVKNYLSDMGLPEDSIIKGVTE